MTAFGVACFTKHAGGGTLGAFPVTHVCTRDDGRAMAVLRPRGGQFRSPRTPPLEGLTAKFARPRTPPSFVMRAHLNALLDQGTKRPLTVVSAGPGWGKTLATTAWASSATTPVAWISLDATDNEPRTFWTCFVSALQGVLDVPPGQPVGRARTRSREQGGRPPAPPGRRRAAAAPCGRRARRLPRHRRTQRARRRRGPVAAPAGAAAARHRHSFRPGAPAAPHADVRQRLRDPFA